MNSSRIYHTIYYYLYEVGQILLGSPCKKSINSSSVLSIPANSPKNSP